MPKSEPVWTLGDACQDLHEAGYSWKEIARAAQLVADEADQLRTEAEP